MSLHRSVRLLKSLYKLGLTISLGLGSNMNAARADEFSDICGSKKGDYNGFACICPATGLPFNPHVQKCTGIRTRSSEKAQPDATTNEKSFFNYFSKDHLKNITSTENTFKRLCIASGQNKRTIQRTWEDTCNAVLASKYCQTVDEKDRIDCTKPSDNAIDLFSYDFLKNCGWGLWTSLKGFAEFIWKMISFFLKADLLKPGSSTDPTALVEKNRDKIHQAFEGKMESMESIKNYFLVEMEMAKDKDPSLSDERAAMKVAGHVLRLAFNKILGHLDQEYFQLGCYSPKKRSIEICKIVADITLPPTALLSAVIIALKTSKKIGFIKAVKKEMAVHRSASGVSKATSKTDIPAPKNETSINQVSAKIKKALGGKGTAANRSPKLSKKEKEVLERKASEEKDSLSLSRMWIKRHQTSVNDPPALPTSVVGYNLSDIVKAKSDFMTSLGAEKYGKASDSVLTVESREAVLGTKIKERLGAGFNGDVVLGEDGFVYKLPRDANGVISLEIEMQVAKRARDFGLTVLENTAVDQNFGFLKRPQVPKELLATEVLKQGPLTEVQEKALEALFLQGKNFAQKTGIGLDLKADNIYWNAKEKQWALLEAAPRTSTLPYGYTLDVENFDQYKRLWNSTEPPSGIEKPRSRELFDNYAHLSRESTDAVNAIENAPVDQIGKVAGAFFSNPGVSDAVKAKVASSLSTDVKVKALVEKINSNNFVDVDTPLRSGIAKSGLKGEELQRALYQATRVSNTRDHLDFFSALKTSTNRQIGVLSTDAANETAAYLYGKATGWKPGIRNLEDLKESISKPDSKVSLLASSQEVRKVVQDPALKKALQEGRFEILISDAVNSGITGFNYRNSDAIAQSLLAQRQQARNFAEFRSEMENLGMGKSIRSVNFDPSAAPSRRLSFNEPIDGQLDFEQAKQALFPRPLTETDIRRRMAETQNQSKERPLTSAQLDLFLNELVFESLQKTNERLGRMIASAHALATRKGYSKDIFYFFGQNDRSPVLFKKMLSESHGIPEDKIVAIGEWGDWAKIHRQSSDGKPALLLIVDDFVGTSKSMRDFRELGTNVFRLKDRTGKEVPFEPIPFAPFMTKDGRNVLSTEGKQVITDVELRDVRSSFAFRDRKSRLGLDESAGYDGSSTAIAFEYMSPDNNMREVIQIAPLWTTPKGIKPNK